VPGNTYEPAVMELLRDVFTKHPSGTFLDIGALYGYFSCYVATLAPKVNVVAFEPSQRSALIAKKNFELNRLTNASLEMVALTSSNRKQEFVGKTLVRGKIDTGKSYEAGYRLDDKALRVEKATDSSVSLSAWFLYTLKHLARATTGWNRREVVNCMPFDGNYTELCAAPVVVKIDVHGAEISVLRGMQRYLNEAVDVLFLEMHRDDMLVEGSHADTVAMLKASGLMLYEIVDFRSNDKWRLQELTEDGLDLLESSKHWGLRDKAVMKMILGIRKGVIDVGRN
jgi:FkbM family methyltransferase